MERDNSILMQKQVRDNSEDLQSEFLDLKNWEEQMKRKEQEMLNERNGQQVIPPVRSKNKKKKCTVKENKMSKNSKRIKSYDYTAWDKFDDKACKKLEDEEQSDESSDEPLSKEELEKNYSKAIEYKQQGNDFVKQKKWDKAIASYSEAIKLFPYDAIFYANRALCYLKQDNLYSAEADCSSAIQLDETYVKAYHRRVTARLGLKQFDAALEDVKKITELEPCNKETEVLLNQIKKQFGDLYICIIHIHIYFEPLKRIPVQEADLSKPFKEKKIICNNNQVELKSNATCKPEENFIENCEEMPPIPTNSVQFLINWKKYTSFDFRYRYLKQIPSGSLPKIFQDSMETDIFSGILTTLKIEFMKRKEPIFSYLKDLSNIKRFRAFIMFISNSEKQDLKLMFSYCNTSEKISEEEITDLQDKYEI
ncbi:RPAP3 protein, partial [Acromyrmex insinuator]